MTLDTDLCGFISIKIVFLYLHYFLRINVCFLNEPSLINLALLAKVAKLAKLHIILKFKIACTLKESYLDVLLGIKDIPFSALH